MMTPNTNHPHGDASGKNYLLDADDWMRTKKSEDTHKTKTVSQQMPEEAFGNELKELLEFHEAIKEQVLIELACGETVIEVTKKELKPRWWQFWKHKRSIFTFKSLGTIGSAIGLKQI